MRYFIIYLSHARNAYTYTHAVVSPLYEFNRAVYGGREMFSIVLCFACLGYKTIWKLKMRISQFDHLCLFDLNCIWRVLKCCRRISYPFITRHVPKY